MLGLCKSVDRRMWGFEHPLSQFDLNYDIIDKLERNTRDGTGVEELRDMSAVELGELVRFGKMGVTLKRCLGQFPLLELDTTIAPITKTVLRITLYITASMLSLFFNVDFDWNDKIHGWSEPYYIWVEDPEHVDILHSEFFLLSKKQSGSVQKLEFVIPIPKTDSTTDQLPPQIYIRAVSERWIGAETVIPVSFKHLILPRHFETPFTDLLDLQPLPISCLKDEVLEGICRSRFDFFNPIQSQIFHKIYHTDENCLLGAPTGSGKTCAAELAMWAAFRERPKGKVVYIAPMKALVKERMADWGKRLVGPMKRKMVELTGDVTPNLRALKDADIIITVPEKWDGITRSWRTRGYVKDVSLVIIDEIHLLGGDRGMLDCVNVL